MVFNLTSLDLASMVPDPVCSGSSSMNSDGDGGDDESDIYGTCRVATAINTLEAQISSSGQVRLIVVVGMVRRGLVLLVSSPDDAQSGETSIRPGSLVCGQDDIAQIATWALDNAFLVATRNASSVCIALGDVNVASDLALKQVFSFQGWTRRERQGVVAVENSRAVASLPDDRVLSVHVFSPIESNTTAVVAALVERDNGTHALRFVSFSVREGAGRRQEQESFKCRQTGTASRPV
jgi:hypothetical protein